MQRRRVSDDYLARWFRYDPVAEPAPNVELEPLARTHIANG
jgi:hypothetical protein